MYACIRVHDSCAVNREHTIKYIFEYKLGKFKLNPTIKRRICKTILYPSKGKCINCKTNLYIIITFKNEIVT